MTMQVDAVYEAGVLRPLGPIALTDRQRVRLTIDGEGEDQLTFMLSEAQWDAFCVALDASPRRIPELQALFREPGVFDDRPGAPR